MVLVLLYAMTVCIMFYKFVYFCFLRMYKFDCYCYHFYTFISIWMFFIRNKQSINIIIIYLLAKHAIFYF